MDTNRKNCSPSSSNDERVAAESFCQLAHKPLDDSPSLSIKDKQLKAVIYMKEVSDRMTDVSCELKELTRIFSSSTDENIRLQKLSMSSLAKTIIPFLDESASRINTASKILAPIGGTDYVHRINESKRTRQACCNHGKDSTK